MLYSYQVYETLLDVCRKDLRGRSLTPEEFNNLAPIINQLVYERYYSQFEATVDNSDSMSAFKVLGETIPLVAGVGTLPARYYHIVGMPYYTDSGGVVRYIDLVSSMEHARREQDYLTKATVVHPTCRLGLANSTADKTIHVTPTSITSISLDYLRTADTPYLDYYVDDTNLTYTWCSSGGVNVNVPAGATYRDGTVGAAVVVSQTVNWEWDAEDLPLIINLFLQYLGVQLPDQVLIESGLAFEQKNDAK